MRKTIKLRSKLEEKGITSEQFVHLIADLFDEVYPDTPEEVDEILREAGLCPDKIGREIADMVQKAMRGVKIEERIADEQIAELGVKWNE